jgi:hypothetical protein
MAWHCRSWGPCLTVKIYCCFAAYNFSALIAESMYQRYDLATGQVSALQELTDEAIDAAITPTEHVSLFHSRPRTSAAGVQDPEAAGGDDYEGGSTHATSSATLNDWRLLKAKLDSAGSLACQHNSCRQTGLGKQALRQQVRLNLPLLYIIDTSACSISGRSSRQGRPFAHMGYVSGSVALPERW